MKNKGKRRRLKLKAGKSDYEGVQRSQLLDLEKVSRRERGRGKLQFGGQGRVSR